MAHYYFDRDTIEIDGEFFNKVHEKNCKQLIYNPNPEYIGFFPELRHAEHDANLRYKDKKFIPCEKCIQDGN